MKAGKDKCGTIFVSSIADFTSSIVMVVSSSTLQTSKELF